MDNKKLKPSLEYVMATIINQFKNDVAKGQKMHFLVIQVLQEWQIFEENKLYHRS